MRCLRNVFFTAEEYRQVLVKYFDVQNAKKEEGEEETQAARCTSGSRENTVAIDPLLADAGQSQLAISISGFSGLTLNKV